MGWQEQSWTETAFFFYLSFSSFFHKSFLNNKSLFMICFIITYGFDVYSNSAKCMDVQLQSTRSSKASTIASSLQVQSVHFVCSTRAPMESILGGRLGRGSKDLKDVCFALKAFPPSTYLKSDPVCKCLVLLIACLLLLLVLSCSELLLLCGRVTLGL